MLVVTMGGAGIMPGEIDRGVGIWTVLAFEGETLLPPPPHAGSASKEPISANARSRETVESTCPP